MGRLAGRDPHRVLIRDMGRVSSVGSLGSSTSAGWSAGGGWLILTAGEPAQLKFWF